MLLGALLTLLAVPAVARGQDKFETDTLQDFHARGDMQGLYEIRDAARTFITRGNAAQRTHWRVLEPNLKTIVTLCAVPLTARWVPKHYGLSMPNVGVTCRKTVDPRNAKPWEVFVPVVNDKPVARAS